MNRIRLSEQTLCLIVSIAVCVIGVEAVAAEPLPWDQKNATRLANEFSKSLDKIAAAAKTAPLQKTAIQQRTRDGAVNRLGSVRETAKALADQLASGRDGDATELFYAQVRQLFQQMQSTARDAVAGEEQRANIDAAQKLLDELGAYYNY